MVFTYVEVFVEDVIAVMDRLEVVLEALLAALEHLLLHLQVAQVLRTLKFGLGLTLSLFLSHLVWIVTSSFCLFCSLIYCWISARVALI